MDGGEHGGEILGRVYVVDADDGKVVRNRQTGFLDGPHSAYGRVVIAAEHGGHICFAGQKLLGPFISSLGGQGDVDDIGFSRTQIVGA